MHIYNRCIAPACRDSTANGHCRWRRCSTICSDYTAVDLQWSHCRCLGMQVRYVYCKPPPSADGEGAPSPYIHIKNDLHTFSFVHIHNIRIAPACLDSTANSGDARCPYIHMGWLWSVGSIKLQVSFAKEPYKRDDILQKRHKISSILLTVATPYSISSSSISIHMYMHSTHRTCMSRLHCN